MGYDMRWVRKADGEEEAHEAARVEFYAAGERRGAIPKEERGEWTKEEMESAVAFENGRAPAIGAWQSWSPAGPGTGIPAHKFGSNDGWHVTPEEAFYAASTIRALDPQVVTKTLVANGVTDPKNVAYWESWVQWLDDASQHGGFEVH